MDVHTSPKEFMEAAVQNNYICEHLLYALAVCKELGRTKEISMNYFERMELEI